MSSIDKVASEAALNIAKTSKAVKRKVGCVIVIDNLVTAIACNYNPNGSCEDAVGQTLPSTVHAEVAAIDHAHATRTKADVKNVTFYVTHQPCDECLKAMRQFQQDVQAIELNTIVVSEGMKFDSGKLDYTLIPQIAIEGLAKVLHYGARKYKRDNWRQVDAQRYVAAFERHWQAYLTGEVIDPETKLPHLAHAMTNLAFLLELKHAPKQQQTIGDYVKNFAK